ncbi:MAG: oxidoreductase [bacterium]|nr:oxidoreductase [bacterium]
MKNLKNIYNLNDKVCVIAGGAGLIGSEFSMKCTENGANVIILDIDSGRGEILVDKIKKETGSDSVEFFECNLNNTDQVNDILLKIIEKYKRIDCLVNSAYPKNKNYGRKFEDVTYEDFCKNVELHLGSYFLVTKEVSKIMQKQKSGNIVNIASIYGFQAPRFEIYGNTKMTVPVEYSAIKGAVINLTKYFASYFSPYNIRVNAISPGGIFDNQDDKFVNKYTQYVKGEKRMAKTEDISGALLFLLSDDSSYINGQNIVVDGGWTL